MQYSDDCDFKDEGEAALIELEKQAKIAEWNLTVDKSETEYVKFQIAAKKEKDQNNKPLHKDEPWRSNSSFGVQKPLRYVISILLLLYIASQYISLETTLIIFTSLDAVRSSLP